MGSMGLGMNEVPSLALAFGMGLLSFLSPCVLPLMPGYITFISGVSLSDLEAGENGGKWKRLRPVILCSLAFILGLCVVLMGLGALGMMASASMHSDWAKDYSRLRHTYFPLVAGVIVIILGIHMTGLWRIKALYQEKRVEGGKGGTIPRAFLLGIAFAFGWSPCTGPVLLGIWTYAATRSNSLHALALMALYSLGLSIPIFLTAIATEQFFDAFDRIKKHFRKIEVTSGVLLILFGIIILFPPLKGPFFMFIQSILPEALQTVG